MKKYINQKRSSEKNANKLGKFFRPVMFLIFVLIFSRTVYGFCSAYLRSTTRLFFRVNIVVKLDDVFLISVSRMGEFSLIKLPRDQKIIVSRGYGEYPVGSVYHLGELDQQGEQLLSESLSEFFGLPIHGSILADSRQCDPLEGPSCLKEILMKTLMGSLRSNLSKYDLAVILLNLRKVEEEGERIFTYKGARPELEGFLSKNFKDELFLRENFALGVFNATEVQGLGSQAARKLVFLGGRIIKIGNSEPRARTVLVAKKTFFKSYTALAIRNIFNPEIIEEEIESDWADALLYIGDDYWKKIEDK